MFLECTLAERLVSSLCERVRGFSESIRGWTGRAGRDQPKFKKWNPKCFHFSFLIHISTGWFWSELGKSIALLLSWWSRPVLGLQPASLIYSLMLTDFLIFGVPASICGWPWRCCYVVRHSGTNQLLVVWLVNSSLSFVLKGKSVHLSVMSSTCMLQGEQTGKRWWTRTHTEMYHTYICHTLAPKCEWPVLVSHECDVDRHNSLRCDYPSVPTPRLKYTGVRLRLYNFKLLIFRRSGKP